MRVDVAARARAAHASIEVAARTARYEFFPDAGRRLGATRVATGHTLDDQAETVLLRLLRGAGTRGLSGIRPRRGIFVRPLIDTPRVALRLYLEARGETWREDASNADVSIARNRLRHMVMPAIAGFSPAAARALAMTADLAAADEAVLENRAIEMLPGLVLTSKESGITLNALALGAAPPALASRVIRLAAADRLNVALGVRHLQAVQRLVVSERSGGSLDLPGARAEKRDGTLTMRRVSGRASPRPPTSFAVALDVPGEASIPAAGLSVTARVRRTPAQDCGPDVAILDAGALRLPLLVRSRRPGDRLRPTGAPGRRKLQDLLVDRKIPRDRRDFVPVVEDADGRVVWVAGVAVADEARARTSEGDVVILELRKDQ
jgi:tRNA(Ile)-lysidine synthase